MIRVAYVCTDPGIPVFGRKGASVHVQAVLRELVRRGAEVHLVCARTGGEPAPDLAGVRVHRLPEVGRAPAAERERAARAADRAVAEVLGALPPLDLVYERYALWGRTATAWAAGRGVPAVLEVNAPLVEEQAAHRELVDRAGAEAVARAALSAAPVVVCVSDAVADWARATSAYPERVVVLPNGVDTDRVVPSGLPARPADAAEFTVGFVGTLKEWHGVDVLLRAVDRLHARDASWRLLVVGDGPCGPALRAAAGPHVAFTGALAPAEVLPQLHRMDVAAAPYPDLPGLYFSPLKLYEYLAAGVPVVASAVGQVPGALGGGRLGALVPPGDAGALAAALADLRADAPGRARLAAEGRRAAEERHTWRAVVERTLAHARLAGVAR
ncbi:glycosyltransferase family 4 protein [Cellulomonas pakistanensis]|uniref:D-inositol 3-phosphate glycosyltransferase n=1 Tax=Cellulomonas pakistanensis TaxID=992287 RepID=A0A919P7U6_9CELL|nr:glycosyltransferase family 4 protein [Cellulomonas pakistanensis]GIG35218.1 glycosyl transferase [Cellulomonas pakistanensis]